MSIALTILSVILILVFITVFNGVKQDRKLIESVTAINRGTKSERNLILSLLKSGIHPQTIFHDLLIKKTNGEFSQVDLVVATTEGIIVIEVKDYSGWIYGNGGHTNWTKVMAYGKKKYKFYNPIKQVSGHIQSIKKGLNQFKNIPIFSIIVFYGDCELKEIDYVPEGVFIIKPHRLLDAIRQIKSNNPEAPYESKQEIVNYFKQAVINGSNQKNQLRHIQNIKNNVGHHRVLN